MCCPRLAQRKAVEDLGFDMESYTLVLTDDDFERALQTFPQLFVEFYAPWCGHCKKLYLIWQDMAKQQWTNGEHNGTGWPLMLAKMDSTVNEETAKKYGIQGFPTLKVCPSFSQLPPVSIPLRLLSQLPSDLAPTSSSPCSALLP